MLKNDPGKMRQTMIDDFADLFGSDYRTASPTVQDKSKSPDELKVLTGDAIQRFNDRVAQSKTRCRVCGVGVTALYSVRYGKSGNSFQFAKPCGHKQ